MLEALANPVYRDLAWKQLPRIVRRRSRSARCAPGLTTELGLPSRPLLFPTSDDQAAGLVGGGAVDAGQVAVILGNSAVVNSSSERLPARCSGCHAAELGALSLDALLQ